MAVQLRVPPPVLLMLRVWVAGSAPPLVAVKEEARRTHPDGRWHWDCRDGECHWHGNRVGPVAFNVTVALWRSLPLRCLWSPSASGLRPRFPKLD